MLHATRVTLNGATAVLEFSHRYPDPTPVAAGAVVRLEEVLGQIRGLLSRQLIAQQEMAAARDARTRMGHALRLHLVNLIRLGHAAARQECDTRFRLLGNALQKSPGPFMTQAAEVLATAAAHREVLLRYGLPSGQLQALQENLLRCQAAHERAAKASADYATAGLALPELARVALTIIRHLDALNRIRFALDPSLLPEWETARNISWRAHGAGASVERQPDTSSSCSAPVS